MKRSTVSPQRVLGLVFAAAVFMLELSSAPTGDAPMFEQAPAAAHVCGPSDGSEMGDLLTRVHVAESGEGLPRYLRGLVLSGGVLTPSTRRFSVIEPPTPMSGARTCRSAIGSTWL